MKPPISSDFKQVEKKISEIHGTPSLPTAKQMAAQEERLPRMVPSL